jgi:hypothetical protein
MAYVAENKRFKTAFGFIKNNNTKHTIEKENAALFNFSISEVTVEDGSLTVVCDTITGDTVEYTLDLDGASAELSDELYNYSVGGTVEMFLAVVWKLYQSTLDDTGVQQDTESYESLHDTITTLTAANAELTSANETLTAANGTLTTANETLSGQVETLTARVQELEAQVAALTPAEPSEQNGEGGAE